MNNALSRRKEALFSENLGNGISFKKVLMPVAMGLNFPFIFEQPQAATPKHDEKLMEGGGARVVR